MAAGRKLGAIVMAAGLGTRMCSRRAKVLHQLAGLPLIRYPLAALDQLGANPVVVVVGHQAEEVIAACGSVPPLFAQQKSPRGTGDAVQCASGTLSGFDGDLLVLPSDLPLLTAETLTALIAAHRDADATVSLLTALVDDPHGYGRILRSRKNVGGVTGIVEDRDATETQRAIAEVNVGVYCVAARFLFQALKRLRPNNEQGELYLTDIVGQAAGAGLVIADTRAPEVEVAHVSSREELAVVERLLRLRIAHRWMEAGVTLEDPETTYIGPEVTIGLDTVIGPSVTLRGQTRIGSDCRLDGSSLIVDSTVGNGVHLKLGVVACEAYVGERSSVGPFAQLRPGTHLGDDVHIGDFVETKNAIIGAGTKANHLAYIGDAEIGQASNVGAGTITCNYDGFRKHRTLIGDRVMIGSDSQLVAPVSIGDDAYIASGTTVMKDVPAGALALNEKRQANRRGWVAARRKREASPGGAKPRPRETKVAADSGKKHAARKHKGAGKRVIAKLHRPAAGKKRR